jgi:flagellar protein FliS
MYVNAMPTHPQTGYLADRVLTASPLELIRMLYEGALSAVDLAIEMLRTNDIMARGKAVTKAVDIIHELGASLRNRPQPEIASGLAELYGYMTTRLLEAHAKKSEPALLEVSRLLKCLYEGWLGVMRQMAESPPETGTSPEPETAVPDTVSPYQVCLERPAPGRSWKL